MAAKCVRQASMSTASRIAKIPSRKGIGFFKEVGAFLQGKGSLPSRNFAQGKKAGKNRHAGRGWPA
jgi:hypothetical protein